MAASTSWTGLSSTSWKNSANWTAGVPSSSVDAIVGDTNFTGLFQPTVSSSASCKSLTIGTGSKASTLTISRALTVSGDVTIGTNGTVLHNAYVLSLTGNWSNSGTYTPGTGPTVTFAGTTQSLTGATTFKKVNINAGSTTTLGANISVGTYITVSGTLDPQESPTYTISGGGTMTVNSGGSIRVKAATFSGNYAMTGTKTISAGSTVDYAASSVNQVVTNSLTYSTLRISGGMTKTLSGNLPALNSSSSSAGSVSVVAGTLDLSTFTANRGTSVAGGSFNISGTGALRIGGTNSFPANYTTHSLSAATTVEYYGTNQTVSAETYGNLLLTSSGSATKTFSSTPFTIAGNFSSATNSGTASVSFTAGAAITVNGSVIVGNGTTFNGSSYSHSVGNNWTNNGTFSGASSTITMNGPNGVITGTGTNNFFNLVIAKSGITVATNTSLNISGDLSTTGTGTLTHNSGGTGTITMTGTSKSISGTSFNFNNLTASGSVSSSSSFSIAGNLLVSGSFSATDGTVSFTGTNKTFSGSGSIAFSSLDLSGVISTTNNFSVSGNLSETGTFSAGSGTATFNGSSTISGSPNFSNVVLNGSLLQLGTDSSLGVAGTFTLTSGTFDVTTTTPNTVDFNGGSQTVTSTTYDGVTFSGSGTKTAAGALTVNRSLRISTGTTFNAGSYTHTIYRNWFTDGTFSAGTSTVALVGALDSAISGTTTFNSLTINKASGENVVTLHTNITVANLNVTTGILDTGIEEGIHTVTVTSTRTGSGSIIGTVIRAHSFSTGVAYAFESPNNTLNFSSVSGITSISVTALPNSVAGFPFGASVNRRYDVSVVGSGAYNATWRLHYLDSELNGNDESSIALWYYTNAWNTVGKSSSDSSANWVEQSGITNLVGSWTLSDNASVAAWTGASSSAWENAANWTAVHGSPTLPPSTNDIAELGTVSFVNQPTINSNTFVKSVSFGSVQSVSLDLGTSGSLTTAGNINGEWTNNSIHTITVNNGTLKIGGALTLSDGTNGHAINLNIGTGTVSITNMLQQLGNAALTLTTGRLEIGGNFEYTSGSFDAGTGTVVYNGDGAQLVGPVSYFDLIINKTGGSASLSAATVVNNDLLVTNSSVLRQTAALSVAGNVTIDSPATLLSQSSTTSLSVGKNWIRNGTFTPSAGTVVFNGSGSQQIAGGSFNNLTINKSSGSATLLGNLTINGSLSVSAGILDMGGYAIARSAVGGTLTLANGTTLLVGNSFPSNFGARTLAASSTVEYRGSSSQAVSGETYGQLILSNGGSSPKTLAAAIAVQGDLLINSNSTLNGSSYLIDLSGNWTNQGTFEAANSTLKLEGTGKVLTGNNTFSNLLVIGSYSVAGTTLHLTGFLNTSGSFDDGGATVTIDGDLLNSGTLISRGTTTFSGTRVQTLQLLGSLVSTASGVINFNGTVAPVLHSTVAPQFVTVNINNTAGITPSIGWTAFGGFVVGPGATFTAGDLTHTFYGPVVNYGTLTSSGTLDFRPSTNRTILLSGTFASTGTVRFGGSGQITLAGSAASFKDVIVANTHTAGVTANTNWTLSGDLTVSSGATFYAGANRTHTISGNINVDGSLDSGTSSITLNGTTTITGNGEKDFNNLLITGSVIASADLHVTGNFTNNGTFDATGATIQFHGTSPGIIAGSTTPVFDSLLFNKTANSVTLAMALNNLNSVTISGGTLDLGGFAFTETAGAGSLSIDAGATLKIGGSNTLPTFTTYTFDPASTVEYAGSGSQTIAVQNYGGLASSSSGARILPSGTVGIAGTFTPGTNSYTTTGNTVNFNGATAQTIPAFNFNNLTGSGTGTRTLASSGTIGVAGTFTPGSNSYTVTGSTVNFSGSSQAIPSFTFNNLTLSSGAKTLAATVTVNGNLANSVTNSGAGKFVLSGGSAEHLLSGSGAYGDLELDDVNGASLSLTNLTVNGSLILSSGRLATSTNKVVMATNGTVLRTNGLVLGSLQKNVATGTNITRTFEVGTTNGYNPVSVNFSNVTVAGNLTATALSGDHPSIASATLFSNKSVNVYWNLAKDASLAFNTNSATFNFNSGDLDLNTTFSKLKIGRFSGGIWSYPTIGTLTATNSQAIGLTNFGDFQLAENANVTPTLSSVSTLAGASEDTSFTINYSTLLAASDAADTDGDAIFFRIESISSGTLTKSGNPVVAGTTLLSTNESLVWTPAANVNGSIAAFTVKASDGSALSASAVQVSVNVTAVNDAPTLTVPGNQTINELTTLAVTNTASDIDGDSLTFALVSAPTGVSINSSSGVITWTPTEAQGPSTNTIFVKVTDNGSPNLSVTNSFTITVNEVNAAPTLTVPGNQTVNELTTLTVTNIATDADSSTLTFALVSGPSGLSIDSASGVITWTPTEAQGPSTNTVSVSVTDNGSPALSVTNSFTVTVNEANAAPILTVPANQTINELTTLTVTNTATDSDVPANTLTFALVSAPTGMSINASSGVITWTPTEAQGPSTNTIVVSVTDNGTPNLSFTNSFTVTVNEVVDGTTPNEAPSFTKGADVLVDPATRRVSITNWATNIRSGSSNEAPQQLTFIVTNNNSAAFVEQPSISTNGTLTFEINASESNLLVTVSAQLMDDGGTANGGVDTSAVQTFRITLSGLFGETERYTSGQGPIGLWLGNLRGLTFPGASKSTGPRYRDMIVGNYLDNTVTVRFCNDDGTFTPDLTYSVGLNPQGVISGDFNQDGFEDIVTANSGTNTISVLMNNTDRTFSSARTLTVGSTANPGPVSVAVGTFDIDTKIDIAVANYNENTVSVLKGLGGGTFSSPTNYNVGQGPSMICTADLNKDSKLDLITANKDADTLTILSGVGNGTFALSQTVTLAASTQPVCVLPADLNGDGKLDLVTANYGSASISVLLQQNDGTFVVVTNYPVGNNPRSLLIRDLNHDGFVDIATANSGSDSVSILINNGDGTFKTAKEVAVGRSPMVIVGSNFNDDEATDLAVTDYLDNKISIFVYSAPLAYNLNFTLNEDTSTTVPVRSVMTGASFVSYFIVDSPTNGIITNDGTNLVYTPNSQYFGTDSFTYFARYQNDGIVVDSAKAKVNLTINSVNDAPSFSMSTNLILVPQAAAAMTISNFVSNLSAGPTNETNQTLTFIITATNKTFALKPSISTNGVLKFQAAATTTGDAIVYIALQDNAYTANGGTNRSTVQTLIIRIIPNLIIPLKGTYNGLFYETADIRNASSGAFNFTMTDKGAYSGSLACAGTNYVLKGQFATNGVATQMLTNGTRRLWLNMQLDLTNNSDQVTGTVSDGVWISDLLGDRTIYNATTNPAPQTGSYTMLFPGTNLPAADSGDGYALLTVSKAGTIALSGTLADGSVISRSTGISKNGVWPFYVSLYSGKGSLLSWITLTNDLTNSVSGNTIWIKSSGVAGKIYSAGFTNELMTMGSLYVPSTNGMPLALTNAEVSLTGGNLLRAITNEVTFTANRITADVGQTNGLILTNVAKTGFISGSFVKPGTTTRLPIKGVILQQQNIARGFFLGTNQSGLFELKAP